MAVALVFALKLRDPSIHLDDELEEFMGSMQPPITEENCSEILRRAERTTSEVTDSMQSNDDDDDEDEENGSDDDEAVLATISDASDEEDDDGDDENDLDSGVRGRGRQVDDHGFVCGTLRDDFSLEKESLEELLRRKSLALGLQGEERVEKSETIHFRRSTRSTAGVCETLSMYFCLG